MVADVITSCSPLALHKLESSPKSRMSMFTVSRLPRSSSGCAGVRGICSRSQAEAERHAGCGAERSASRRTGTGRVRRVAALRGFGYGRGADLGVAAERGGRGATAAILAARTSRSRWRDRAAVATGWAQTNAALHPWHGVVHRRRLRRTVGGPGSNRILRVENPGGRSNALFDMYGGRVLAMQHRALSDSPIQTCRRR